MGSEMCIRDSLWALTPFVGALALLYGPHPFIGALALFNGPYPSHRETCPSHWALPPPVVSSYFSLSFGLCATCMIRSLALLLFVFTSLRWDFLFVHSSATPLLFSFVLFCGACTISLRDFSLWTLCSLSSCPSITFTLVHWRQLCWLPPRLEIFLCLFSHWVFGRVLWSQPPILCCYHLAS